MSNIVIIKEGGKGRKFNGVDKLKVNNADGTVSRWMPEDRLEVGSLHASENGLYLASEDGYFAYDEVSVNVTSGGSVTQKDSTTGNTYQIGVDEDGYIEKTLIPSAIKIVTPPNKTEYSNGETIDYTGIEVQLLCGDGTVFTDATYPDGMIPFSELIFPVTTADASGG